MLRPSTQAWECRPVSEGLVVGVGALAVALALELAVWAMWSSSEQVESLGCRTLYQEEPCAGLLRHDRHSPFEELISSSRCLPSSSV